MLVIHIFNVVLVAILETLRSKRQAYDQWQNTLSGETYKRKQGPTGRKSATRTRLYCLILFTLHECHFPYDDRITTRCACFTCFLFVTIDTCIRLQASVLSHRECYHR